MALDVELSLDYYDVKFFLIRELIHDAEEKNKTPQDRPRPPAHPRPDGPGTRWRWRPGRASRRPRSTTTWPATGRRSRPSCIAWRRCAGVSLEWLLATSDQVRDVSGHVHDDLPVVGRAGAGRGEFSEDGFPVGEGWRRVSRPYDPQGRQRLRRRGARQLHEPPLRGQGDRRVLAQQGMALRRLLRGQDHERRVPDQAGSSRRTATWCSSASPTATTPSSCRSPTSPASTASSGRRSGSRE